MEDSPEAAVESLSEKMTETAGVAGDNETVSEAGEAAVEEAVSTEKADEKAAEEAPTKAPAEVKPDKG